mmetsp:Transcript_36314/g.32588  ORF Transcript_36314/g.32588 Transcript_36314/m.32588 type:complete len:283 (-) Transcript_36314:184-1032(-)
MLIITSLSNISDPFGWLVTTLLRNLQKSDSQSRSGEHGNLEVNGDRRFVPNLIRVSLRKLHITSQQSFVITLEFLDSPHNTSILRLMSSSSDISIGLDNSGVLGAWDLDNDVGSIDHSVIESFQFDSDFNLCLAHLVVNRHDLEGEVHILSNSVGHEFKGTIGRNESDSSFFVKCIQSDTLMEFQIINNDTSVAIFSLLALSLHKELVIHTKLASGHTRKLSFTDDLALNISSQDGSFAGKQHIDILNDINVDLVPLVKHILVSPTDSTSSSGCDLFELIQI